MALNLGTLIADGYIAVEAHDGQQVKNVGKDVLALAKKLSVSQSVLARGQSISQFAENDAWDQLNEELEATQNEVKKALEENRDTDLITLVSIGGWIRGTEVVTGLVLQNYNAENAKLLRQPALVSYLKDKLTHLPDKIQKDPLVQKVSRDLDGIQKMVSFSADHVPSVEEVKDLNTRCIENNERNRSFRMIRFILTTLAACLVLSWRCLAADTDDQVIDSQRRHRFCRSLSKRRIQNPGWQLFWESFQGSSGNRGRKPLQWQRLLVHRVLDRTKGGKIESIGVRRYGKARQLSPVRIRYPGCRRF